MPTPSRPSSRPVRPQGADVAPVTLRDAALGWLAAWLIGALVSSAVMGASGATDAATAGPGWLFAASVAQWVPMVAVVWSLGRRDGAGDLVRDYAYRFRPIDLVGVPLGVATQWLVLPVLYWPLHQAWPATFNRDRLQQRADDLYHSAHGVGMVLLVAVVVVGAPLVEELAYRGLLQGAVSRRIGRWLGLVAAAAWFAFIHFEPVEYPGLFVAGLVFGLGMVLTGRLGMGVVAHLAFNATGLLLVAR